jgi:hypothetical protein
VRAEQMTRAGAGIACIGMRGVGRCGGFWWRNIATQHGIGRDGKV